MATTTTVQFDTEIERLRRQRSRASAQDDGIYNIRARSRASSTDRRGSARAGAANELDDDDDPGLRRSGDYKTRQVYHGRQLVYLAYQSIGVIYGDIGTSPLYVYSSTFTAPPNTEDLVGALSIIIWSLTLMVTIKYVLIILYADNDGEGGTFSTYSLLSRYLHITNRDPREASLIEMKRHQSLDLQSAGRHMRKGIEGSKIARALLKIIGVLAVSMVISDGVLTPAQSVLGAVQGIQVVNPDISKSTIIGTTAAILIVLFLIQPFGTEKLAVAFAPIVIIWLAFNAVFGIYNLAHFDWTVLKAFNPGYGFQYLIRHGEHGWRSLGGILLAFTGVEALFADLGAFSLRAIQLSWLCYAFPCLLLAYVGQAAYISVHPEAFSNPFYNAVPKGTLYPSLIIAILAAIVASQAIITATFQLMAQIMKLSYFPQIKVVHTSKTFHGQLYVPVVNWLLMVGTVLIASIYNNTTSLGNAYGVCVMFVTFFDTCMVSLSAIFVWKMNPYMVLLPWLIIACLDGTYLSAALIKVPDGAWFTLSLSAVLAATFILWRFGKEQQWKAESEDRFPTSYFVQRLPSSGTDGEKDDRLALVERFGNTSLSRIHGFGIFFDKAGETTPIVFSQFVLKLVAAPAAMAFFHLRPLERPSVPPDERYSVSRLAIPNCYRVVVRHGYMDEVITPDLARIIYEQLRNYIIRDGQSHVLVPLELTHRALSADHPTHQDAKPGVEDDETVDNLQLRKRTNLHVTEQAHHLDPQANASADEKTDKMVVPSKNLHYGSQLLTSENDTSDEFHRKQTETELAKLDAAFAHQVLYIIGKEEMKVRHQANWLRRILLHMFLFIRDNTRTKIANLKIPNDRVIEVGFIKDVG